jgi:hypothetical protein
MAEDRYRLEPVRDARERVETVRRGELASAIGDASVTEAELARAHQRVVDRVRALATALAARPREARAAELAAADRFITRCRRDLEAARDAELRAQAAHDARTGDVELARATLVRARADRQVIERHFARWRETQRKLADRRED